MVPFDYLVALEETVFCTTLLFFTNKLLTGTNEVLRKEGVVPCSRETRSLPLPTRYRIRVYDTFTHDVVKADTRADVIPSGIV